MVFLFSYILKHSSRRTFRVPMQRRRQYFMASAHVLWCTVYPKKYAHGFVVLCFVVVMQSFIMNSHEVFMHIHQGCFAGTGAIVRLPQCQWCKPGGHGKISQCITTTQYSKAKTVCIFLGIYYKGKRLSSPNTCTYRLHVYTLRVFFKSWVWAFSTKETLSS